VDGLMRRADVAMYVAKAARVPFELYSAEQDLYTRERLTMVTELRRAIDGNRLQLHYQPVIDLAARRVVGVEALARWPHPDRGLVAADQFIPLAEHAGLIRKLTSHVLEAALSQARTWRDAGMPLIVAVNVSARDLMDPRLPEEVEAALHRHDLGAEYLELEITESSIMDQPARGEAVLGRLSAMGVALAIDDFGTGYSSLAYLQRLPVQRLKIDRSFVVRLATSDGDAAIVRSTVDLGRNLGLAVVAEGVEDEESLERLAGMGCDMVQGFHFARPMPPEDVIEWLRGSGFPLAEPRPLSSGATDDVAKAS
jgi:EAL domain-containing protein (putative c-di-GMP-specific phosphodiesterase class I)